jgi:hypothetical protein
MSNAGSASQDTHIPPNDYPADLVDHSTLGSKVCYSPRAAEREWAEPKHALAVSSRIVAMSDLLGAFLAHAQQLPSYLELKPSEADDRD